MASQVRVYAVLEDWSVLNNLNPNVANSYTSPPFKSDSRPDIGWKLRVKNGNTAGSHCHHGGSADQCEECAKCLEFSLELEGGGEAKDLDPELFVTVTGILSDVQISKTEAFRKLPDKLDLPAWWNDQPLENPVISACVSFNAASKGEELPNVVQSGVSRLLDEPKYADFEVRVGEERIPIHRNIFASFSPVFERMFERDMEEKAQGFVVVEDFSAETMRGLRAFLYSGRVAEVRADLATYLDLGEKYQIKELKDYCHAELRKALTPENLCERALLADKYGLEELFDDCRRAIKGKDWGGVTVPKAHWDKLAEENLVVAVRLLPLSFTN